ncbi:hypothetical protein [Paraburkholderia caledonica]|jgi:hypothetical protein|uniref:hypothetical protein n=1 Tax=Paraburkholderia caledonica TaxID=134536 RepID=UPI0012EBEEA1|nr:hypothetical protein [Paraburkholderia caledonica]
MSLKGGRSGHFCAVCERLAAISLGCGFLSRLVELSTHKFVVPALIVWVVLVAAQRLVPFLLVLHLGTLEFFRFPLGQQVLTGIAYLRHCLNYFPMLLYVPVKHIPDRVRRSSFSRKRDDFKLFVQVHGNTDM